MSNFNRMGEENVRNATEKLRKLLRSAQYPQLNSLNFEAGDVSDMLRVLHFILLDSSRAVAQFLVDKGYDLYGKTDVCFVESVFHLLRNEFRYFPSLSVTQFLSKQFVARKLEIVADTAAAVAQKREELQRKRKMNKAVWSQPEESSKRREVKPSVRNHVLPLSLPTHAASILYHLNLQAHDDQRRIRQASSEMPIQICDEEQHEKKSFIGKSALKYPEGQNELHASHVKVRFPGEKCGQRQSKGNFAECGTEQAENCVATQPMSCDTLVKAMGELSQQVKEMSSTLLNKLSAIENRFSCLENQLRDVRTAVQGQRELTLNINSTKLIKASSDLSNGIFSPSQEVSGKQKVSDIEQPCAWPPNPAVFERY